MRMIFERDIEHCDFLEVILTRKEVELLFEAGVVEEFESGLEKGKALNVFIRAEKIG